MDRISFVLLILLISSFYSNAGEKKIYAWKDKNGVLVFSDTPRVGAKEVKLISQELEMPSINTDILHSSTTISPIQYKAKIISPEHKKTLRENTGTIYVTSRIEPFFEKNFKIQLFLNGIAQGEPGDATAFVLHNVDRGEHTLQIKIFRGQQLVTASDIHTFYLHRKGLNITN